MGDKKFRISTTMIFVYVRWRLCTYMTLRISVTIISAAKLQSRSNIQISGLPQMLTSCWASLLAIYFPHFTTNEHLWIGNCDILWQNIYLKDTTESVRVNDNKRRHTLETNQKPIPQLAPSRNGMVRFHSTHACMCECVYVYKGYFT